MVTDRNFDVVLDGTLPVGARGYRFLVQDTVPDTFSVFNGQSLCVIDARANKAFRMKYSVRTSVCGKAAFPGLRVEASDHWGFFRTEMFVPAPQESTVLPFLIRPQTTVSVLKHNNLQQHIGHHRNRAVGVSSELLGIRDYRNGDPPRTIAWKPTARLGKLMTCEFESEVPIRATIVVDLAAYQFQGRPGPTAADRAITTTASIARLLLADRDPVGVSLITSSRNFRIGHGGGERQLTKILQYLMAASNPNPPLHKFSIDTLVDVVFENAYRRFPELFDEMFNRVPHRFSWLRFDQTRKRRVRAALALVLEHLLELEPGRAARLQFDDKQMGNTCLRYVDRYSVVSSSTTVALDTPGYDPAKWRYERQRVTQVVCDQIAESVSRAKDNELLVVVSPEPVDRIGSNLLETTLRNTIAAKHRVVFVAPQPPGLGRSIVDPVASRIIKITDRSERRNAYSEFKESLTSVGAAFSRIDDPGLMQMVAMEVGLLQSAKNRSRGVRAV